MKKSEYDLSLDCIEDAIYNLNCSLKVLTNFFNKKEPGWILTCNLDFSESMNNINSFLESFEACNFDNTIRRVILLDQPLLDEVIYNVEKLNLGLDEEQVDQLLDNIEESLLGKVK